MAKRIHPGVVVSACFVEDPLGAPVTLIAVSAFTVDSRVAEMSII